MEYPNIILPDAGRGMPFEKPSGLNDKDRPEVDRFSHASRIANELERAMRADASAAARGGSYVRFNTSEELLPDPGKFEDLRSDITLLSYERKSDGTIAALVYVSKRGEQRLTTKIADYGDPEKATKTNKPKNRDFVESLSGVAAVSVWDLWRGNKSDFPKTEPVWCELWIDTTIQDAGAAYRQIVDFCSIHGIAISEDSFRFPECLVLLLKLNNAALEQLYEGVGFISEVRKAFEPVSTFTRFDSRFQRELADAVKVVPADNEVSVCLLDTGVNSSHPLLEPAIPKGGVVAAESEWSANDVNGHGTMMAGVATYNDLKRVLLGMEPVCLSHSLESVKLLPDSGSNEPHLYATVTSNAVSTIEIARQRGFRAFCMAVTDPARDSTGAPSSWSAGIDSIIAAADSDEEDKRLFLISAGNIRDFSDGGYRYPDSNTTAGVEDPAQAWNALTVGAFSDDVLISEPGFDGWKAVAGKGSLAPFSTTSCMWDKGWPIKPEICCDGGNLATDGAGNYQECDDLNKLTTSRDIPARYFTSFNATSAATAQAACFAGRIMARQPDLWPETVRALMVHSARWTESMKAVFLSDEDKATKAEYRHLLKTCGWGVPNLDYALASLDNRVNLIVQGEIRPYTEDGKINEMKLHELPWPNDVLLDLGAANAELRVTLSYFIEPNPGERGWSSKFRYQSAGLRFQVNNAGQTREDFLKLVNRRARESKDDKGGPSGSEDWVIGSQSRDVGSIHSDFKQMTAAQLSDMRYIAVYPVGGWWKDRKRLKMAGRKMRYSLVVTIETEALEAPLYNEIKAKIPIYVKSAISTPVQVL